MSCRLSRPPPGAPRPPPLPERPCEAPRVGSRAFPPQDAPPKGKTPSLGLSQGGRPPPPSDLSGPVRLWERLHLPVGRPLPSEAGGLGAVGQKAHLGGHTLRQGLRAVELRAGHLTALPVLDGCFFTCRGGKTKQNCTSGRHSPCPQSEPYCSCSHTQGPSQLPQGTPRRVPALPPLPHPSPLPPAPARPGPTHPRLLTAGAVQQLHDPKAVVQQGFGPHQLQAQPPVTREGQHGVHRGAELHVLGGRTRLGTGHRPARLWGLSHLEPNAEVRRAFL